MKYIADTIRSIYFKLKAVTDTIKKYAFSFEIHSWYY